MQEQYYAKRYNTIDAKSFFAVVRCAETCTEVMPEWVDLCFDKDEKYIQMSMSFPRQMLRRENLADYTVDPPITQFGYGLCQALGDGFNMAKTRIQMIICAPTLRCIQTAQAIHAVIQSDKSQAKICVEYGFCHFLGKADSHLPAFFDPEFLLRMNYAIFTKYKPQVTISQLSKVVKTETKKQFYERVKTTLERLKKSCSEMKEVMIVVTSDTMDALFKAAKHKSADHVLDSDLKGNKMDQYYPALSNGIICRNTGDPNGLILLRALTKLTHLGITNDVDIDYLKTSINFEGVPDDEDDQKRRRQNKGNTTSAEGEDEAAALDAKAGGGEQQKALQNKYDTENPDYKKATQVKKKKKPSKTTQAETKDDDAGLAPKDDKDKDDDDDPVAAESRYTLAKQD
ncbi:unnamed protein product [Bursaphelenchus okinawaensis]|uniref:Uncharacterized protein n=1 Tax=Bursaphelenchus okinawaensis TaxID=465554 RepID=A0A811LPX4_9BILA|nr:unnamed protein product [Bursaphelenchus okinawaensis]CAG9125262.1 unnamed protein product [Bursaphelenchus okinawaensis]